MNYRICNVRSLLNPQEKQLYVDREHTDSERSFYFCFRLSFLLAFIVIFSDILKK